MHMVVKMLEEPGVRCACVREVQDSIRDSVRQLLVRAMQRMGVAHEFDLLEQELRHKRHGATVIFKGMKDQNAESIKSMEGIKYCWWEEAQTASDKSIRLLRPTIRAPGSQLWFTWNPRKRTDPVDLLLRGGATTDAERCVVKANYMDNKWFPEELELERQIDERGDEENYSHVWLGAYQVTSDMQFIADKDVRAAQAREVYTDLNDVVILGVDVARFGDDKSVIQIRRGMDAKSFPPIIREKVDTMTLAGLVKETSDKHDADMVFIDEGGIGAGVVDRCHQLGMRNVVGINFGAASDRVVIGLPKTLNKRTEMWAVMRMALQSSLCLRESDKLGGELTGPLYSYDEQNRIRLEKKSDMKKRGVPSPDEADALALTFAYPVEARRAMEMHEARQQAQQEYNPWG